MRPGAIIVKDEYKSKYLDGIREGQADVNIVDESEIDSDDKEFAEKMEKKKKKAMKKN